jgi:inosine-uridine nucleoside N-ribohydrolase
MRKLTLFVVTFGLARFAFPGTVWIDTDVSIGSPIREVDDAYALVLAFHSPEVRIAGVSTTYGNAPLVDTTRIARDLVKRFGPAANVKPHQVFAGAGSAADLGRRSEASEALARALEKDSVTYVALGPLTNLATFLQLHARLASRIERVIFVGGQAQGTTLAFGPKQSFHIHDANVFKDPRAAASVLHAKLPLTLTPIATGSELVLNADDLRELERHGDAGNFLSRHSRVWLWFWTHFVQANGGPIFDALAVVAATRPKLISIEKRYAKMDESGNLIVTDRLTRGARTVRYGRSFVPGTKQFVMRRLLLRRSRE